MILIQFTGLSGSGKSSLANQVQAKLINAGYDVEIIDGDAYRKIISKELGFSKQDRIENINRLFFIGSLLVKYQVIVLLAVINPYENTRLLLRSNVFVRTVYIKCSLKKLIARDTKGLYYKALLPDSHPDKLHNLSGINDVFEIPSLVDFTIDTEEDSVEESSELLLNYILSSIQNPELLNE